MTLFYLLIIFYYYLGQQLQVILQERKRGKRALEKSCLKDYSSNFRKVNEPLQLWPVWYNFLNHHVKKSDTITTSSWFQQAPTSAWEEPVLIPTSKSPVTSTSSLTLASTSVIKFQILSSKRNSSLLRAVDLLTDTESIHILRLSSFIICILATRP